MVLMSILSEYYTCFFSYVGDDPVAQHCLYVWVSLYGCICETVWMVDGMCFEFGQNNALRFLLRMFCRWLTVYQFTCLCVEFKLEVLWQRIIRYVWQSSFRTHAIICWHLDNICTHMLRTQETILSIQQRHSNVVRVLTCPSIYLLGNMLQI